MSNKNIILASTGASGAHLTQKILEYLPKEFSPHIITTKNSKLVIKKEYSDNIKIFDDSNTAADIASGSYKCGKMIIGSCSMNTLAKIATGIADNLVTRSAAVMIKENRQLLIAPRELPFSPIALENMLKLSSIGVVIAPPVLAFYSQQKSVSDMERFIIGKWFDLLNIENTLYNRWSDK